MAKKEKPPVASAPLKHSPFAALRAQRDAVGAPEPEASSGGSEGSAGTPASPTTAPERAAAPDVRSVAERRAREHTGATAPDVAPIQERAREAGDREAGAPSQRSAPTGAAARVEPPSAPPGKSRGRLVQRRETKHRAGKAVIIVSGFEELRDFDAAALEALAKELKQALGCGGTLETRAGRRELVLQGDRPAQVAALLRARGFRVDGVTS